MELLNRWEMEGRCQDYCTVTEYIAAHSAQWGADQELEACCEVLARELICDGKHVATDLRMIRRPKPPSLKERALESLHHLEAGCMPNIDLLRLALEQLPDEQ